MNSHQHPKEPWERLVAAARHARDQSDDRAPYGFSVRVAALAELAPRTGASLFEHFALRAVGLAALLALGSIAFTLTQSPRALPSTDAQSESATDDALSALVDA